MEDPFYFLAKERNPPHKTEEMSPTIIKGATLRESRTAGKIRGVGGVRFVAGRGVAEHYFRSVPAQHTHHDTA